MIDKQLLKNETTVTKSEVYTFRQQYKFLNHVLVADLANEFAKKQGLQVEIRTWCSSLSKTAICYEIDFMKAGDVWIRIMQESSKADILRKLGNGVYTENVESDPQKEIFPRADGAGKLAIVIDDLGYQMDVFNKLIKLDYEITYSILPQLTHSFESAEIASQAGRLIILHLPMQPKDQSTFNPGPGALLTQDTAEQIYAKMTLNLSTVPYALGVNNHMGSAFTQYAEGLDAMMGVLGENTLFFLDSKTAPGDTAKKAAKNHFVPYLSRDIFLDNDENEELIRKQLFKAVKLARKRGRAIAIGHPYPETHAVLEKYLPELKAQGVVLVKLIDLLN
ncbi:MAG: divergent polysaccharide deacetylase family protein [SAR324 cluster bacterium]|nr:divergent polysaccharide deacetylase family protein [SAR324 cluster bacterium]